MKKLSILILLFSLLLPLCMTSCDKDDNKEETKLVNQLIGTWKYQSPDDYYWYQFTFNENLTGVRDDADGDHDEFTYTFSSTEINFTSDFPSGKYTYSITNNQLNIFGNILIKQ